MAARDTTDRTDVHKYKLEPDGTFKRPAARCRDFISVGGKFEPAPGRYVLYVSYACPWAHRTLIVRKLKGLEDILPVRIVSPRMGKHGWPFANTDPYAGADVDDYNHADHIKDVYLKGDPDYAGRFSVPVLWDTQTSTVVNNESSEIIRMLNSSFNHLLPGKLAKIDLYPPVLQAEIDSINGWVYETVNNGVYKCGMAATQEAYEKVFDELFESLDRVEALLKGKDFLVGSQLTEADIRLYPTIVRFDPVYFGLFKCNLHSIRDGYPEIHRWLRNIYWSNDAFKSTTNFDHIKTHYWWSLANINPKQTVPKGPIPHILPL